MVARRTYRKPVPRGPRRYLRPAAPSMWQPICRTSTASWPTDLAGIEEIEDAVARRDIADLGRRIDEPALRRHVRDRDQLGARTDRALECLKAELPGRVVAEHVHRDPDARLHLQEREVVRHTRPAR